MSKRPAVNTADGYAMPAEAFERMRAAMMELAMRGSKEEQLVMRIAKAGEIKEITKQLTTLRNYGKKMGLVRAPRPPRDTPKGKRKRKGVGGSGIQDREQDPKDM
jgi:hypothetical protein